jgi:hypothetical protein
VLHCGGEIGAYTTQPNFCRWKMLEALLHIRHSGGDTIICSWSQLDKVSNI